MAKLVNAKGWIKQHKKLCIFMTVLLVVAVLAGSIGVRAKSAREKMREAMNQPQTAAVEKRTLVSSISATGKVASAESKEITVSLTGVEITSIPVEVGDLVEEGTLLCEFDSEDIEQNLADARAALSVSSGKTQLDLSVAKRNLEEAQATSAIDQERMNQDVADAWNDYLLAVTDMEEAEDEWEEAKTTTGEKEAELELRVKLHAEAKAAGVSGNELAKYQEDEANWRTKVNTASQAEGSAEAAYEKAKTAMESKLDAYEKQVRSQEDSLRSNEAAIASKTDSLASSQLNASTSTTSDKQKVEEYEEQLENCTLKSPVNGVITAITADVGDTYSGGTLFTIEDISAYEVSAEIDEYDIGKVKEGQTVVIKTNGTGDEELKGTVKQIAPRATSTTGQTSTDVTYNVRISIDTPNDLLKLDMTAKLSIILESKENVLTVPYEAVQEDENGKFYVEVESEGIEGEEEWANQPARPNDGGEKIPVSSTSKIYVEKGIESDYYIEVISKEITEGMQVIVPQSGDEGMDIRSMIMNQGPMGGF